MKGVDDLISEHPFTKGLDQDTVGVIAGCARNVVFDQDAFIFKEGGSADHFYLIRHGRVALEFHYPSKPPVIFLTLDAGQILGSGWIAPPYRWSYDSRAMETVRAISFDANCLRKKCEGDPKLGYELMKRFITPLVQRLNVARMLSVDIYHAPDS